MLNDLRLTSPLARLALRKDPVAPTFTDEQQAHIDSLMGRTRAEAERVAQRTAAAKLEEQLGGTIDEAKAALEAKAAADDDAKSEAERLRDEAKADRDAAAREKAEAARGRLDAKIERKLLAAGVGAGLDVGKPEEATKLEAALARARRSLDIADDADDTAIAAEVDALKAEVPGLFGTLAADPPRPGGQTITPARPPASPPGGRKSLAEIGQAGLADRGWAPPSTSSAA